MRHRTLPEIENDCREICKCVDLIDLCKITGLSFNDLILHSLHQKYYRFNVVKQNGGLREIEAPSDDLKSILQVLNYYLQAVYFKSRTKSAYGYIITPSHTKSEKNIVANARMHLGKHYMLKADIEDFFHQISTNDVAKIFKGNIMSFDSKSSVTLARLCTYNNRLPMGAPTSPVLSNFFAIDIDNDLQAWANKNGITFTRFVDDLTFSSHKPLSTRHLDVIQKTCSKYHLKLNERKTKSYCINDTKEVTGLVLNKTVDIPVAFYDELDHDISSLHNIYEASVLTRQTENNTLLQKFKQKVQGQVNFIGMVEGYHSAVFKKYCSLMRDALKVEEDYLSMRWTHFSYL